MSSEVEGRNLQQVPSAQDYAQPRDNLPVAQSVSVVIPTYNEAENIIPVVERIKNALRTVEFEVLIIDDDSPDSTWRIAELRFEDDPTVFVHRRQEDKGLGKAIAFGIRQSTHPHIAVIDADLQHPPEILPELLFHMDEDVDIVIGSRHTDFGQIQGWPLFRQLVSSGARLITKFALPQTRSLRDPLSGFFVVRRSRIQADALQPTGYKILLEVLIKGDLEKAVEVPYTFSERQAGNSKLTMKEYLSFIHHILMLRSDSK